MFGPFSTCVYVHSWDLQLQPQTCRGGGWRGRRSVRQWGQRLLRAGGFWEWQWRRWRWRGGIGCRWGWRWQRWWWWEGRVKADTSGNLSVLLVSCDSPVWKLLLEKCYLCLLLLQTEQKDKKKKKQQKQKKEGVATEGEKEKQDVKQDEYEQDTSDEEVRPLGSLMLCRFWVHIHSVQS